MTYDDLYRASRVFGGRYDEIVVSPLDLLEDREVVTPPKLRPRERRRKYMTISVPWMVYCGVALLANLRGVALYEAVDLAVREFIVQHKEEIDEFFGFDDHQGSHV